MEKIQKKSGRSRTRSPTQAEPKTTRPRGRPKKIKEAAEETTIEKKIRGRPPKTIENTQPQKVKRKSSREPEEATAKAKAKSEKKPKCPL